MHAGSHPLTPFQAKLWLLHLKSSLSIYRCISRNVAREVCRYIGRLGILVSVESATLRLYYVDTRCVVTRSLPVRFSQATAVCVYEEEFALCLALQPAKAYEIRLRDYTVSLVLAETKYRRLPGLTAFEAFIYVFGGADSFGRPKRSSEKYAAIGKAWLPVPDMPVGKCAFTPAVHMQDIYLCAVHASSLVVDVFTPSHDAYTSRMFTYPTKDFSCVAYVCAEQLTVIIGQGTVLRYNLASRYVASVGSSGNMQQATACVHWLTEGDYMYWIAYAGRSVHRFEGKSGQLADISRDFRVLRS